MEALAKEPTSRKHSLQHRDMRHEYVQPVEAHPPRFASTPCSDGAMRARGKLDKSEHCASSGSRDPLLASVLAGSRASTSEV
jgi:hypothetical protein